MKENQTISQTTAFVKKHTKNVLSIIVAASIATASFKLGAKYGNPEKKEIAENPYAHAFSPEEISIAVNESNELIMIERATGKYIVYSDMIGETIFGMYANRIKQEVNAGK